VATWAMLPALWRGDASAETIMKSERLGLLLIGAALLVTAVVVGLWYDRQATLQRTHIRNQGVSLVRVLSSLSYEQLLPKPGRPHLLQTVLQMNRNTELGYGVIVDTRGATLSEVTMPGTLVPAAPRTAAPSPGSASAPWYPRAMDARSASSTVRCSTTVKSQATSVLVFLRPRPRRSAWTSFPSPRCSPCRFFLLAPLFHFLLKREMRPLRELGERMRQLSVAGPAESSEPAVLGDPRDLVGRVARFIELTHVRIREIEAQRFTAQTSSHVLSYRHEKVESVLHALPEALMVLDDSGVVTFANAKLKYCSTSMPKQSSAWKGAKRCCCPKSWHS